MIPYCNNKKESTEFLDAYDGRRVRTEVVSNITPSGSRLEKVFSVFHYGPFKEGVLSRIRLPELFDSFGSNAFFAISHFGPLFLREKFGKCHFKYEGNRDYQIWVMSPEARPDIAVLLPAKPEVVIPEGGIDEDFLSCLEDFFVEWHVAVLDFAMRTATRQEKEAFHLDGLAEGFRMDDGWSGLRPPRHDKPRTAKP